MNEFDCLTNEALWISLSPADLFHLSLARTCNCQEHFRVRFVVLLPPHPPFCYVLVQPLGENILLINLWIEWKCSCPIYPRLASLTWSTRMNHDQTNASYGYPKARGYCLLLALVRWFGHDEVVSVWRHDLSRYSNAVCQRGCTANWTWFRHGLIRGARCFHIALALRYNAWSVYWRWRPHASSTRHI